MAEGLTKKQLKDLRKIEKMQSKSLEAKSNMVKWISISAVSLLFLILFVGVIIAAKNKNKPQTASGSAQFANNGHERMLTSKGTDASASAIPTTAAVTLVEYGDIECPACKAYHPIVKELLTAYPDLLKLIFKNFPLKSVHPHAMEAAIAAEAAGRQGKYFGFVDMAYENQDSWAGLDDRQPKFEEFAKSLGLNLAQFRKDQKDPAITKLINDEENEGIQNGVNGTPTFFVDGTKIDNPANLDAFKKIISSELEKKVGGDVSQQASPTITDPRKLPLQ